MLALVAFAASPTKTNAHFLTFDHNPCYDLNDVDNEMSNIVYIEVERDSNDVQEIESKGIEMVIVRQTYLYKLGALLKATKLHRCIRSHKVYPGHNSNSPNFLKTTSTISNKNKHNGKLKTLDSFINPLGSYSLTSNHNNHLRQ